ncbi:MAG: hypothetical protein P8K06_03575, partial [Porticoccaceae bacterium]|nr:hypothetical protein [Porticoccaceae bacterium]
MKEVNNAKMLVVAISTAIASLGQVAYAQDANELSIEEVVTVGSRSNEPRSATESPVPVDVLSEAELSAFGNQAD